MRALAVNPENTEWLRNADMTWCRDQKEQHCFVRVEGEDVPEPVTVSRPRPEALTHRSCTLADERWLVPEALFSPSQYGVDGRSITLILLAAAVAAAIERPGESGAADKDSPAEQLAVLLRLLRSIIVVGGASALPNLGKRLEVEIVAAAASAPGTRELLAPGGPEELVGGISVVVLRPAGEFSSGDAVYQGGCILSSSANSLVQSLDTDDPPPWLSRMRIAPAFSEECHAAVRGC